MKAILGDTFFEWCGGSEILRTNHYKITLNEHPLLIGLNIDSEYEGIVILGKIQIVVDTLSHNAKYGAVGNTINFQGTNLVIIGLSLEDLDRQITEKVLDESSFNSNLKQAELMIGKLRSTLDRPDVNINLDEDEENFYIVFARRNFFLMGTDSKTIVINNKQISIKEGEHKLVEIDPVNGILIANSEKVFSLGTFTKDKMSVLGEFGVNLASGILRNLVWE
ncbi:MAG: hypothetical protein ACTSW1_12705 [Candidatus Hodarchaeales archaeon]